MPNYTESEVDAAVCLWEEFLNRDSIHRYGTIHMRQQAIGLSRHLARIYDKFVTTYPDIDVECFDWEFVPRFVDLIEWVAGTAVLPGDTDSMAKIAKAYGV